MHRRHVILQLLIAGMLASLPAHARKWDQEGAGDCKHLSHEVHKLRKRLAHEPDFKDREGIGYRLRELEEERAYACRGEAYHGNPEEHCRHLAHEEHKLRERFEREPDFEDRQRIGFHIHEIEEERVRECRGY